MTVATTPRAASIDHLVVLASDLETGAAWCRRLLGVEPAAGGEHPLMGTHNRLLDISSAAHPGAYLEIIAINAAVAPQLSEGRRRWFDMDDAALRRRIDQDGPQLIHWVARVPDLAASTDALAGMGLQRGAIVSASRPTPQGLLQWQITVRPDGRRLLDGCLPTLIQWGERHPCQHLPASGVQLLSLQLAHPEAGQLARAGDALGLPALQAAAQAPACIEATLSTPRGRVTLGAG